jgi:hypothetical protein
LGWIAAMDREFLAINNFYPKLQMASLEGRQAKSQRLDVAQVWLWTKRFSNSEFWRIWKSQDLLALERFFDRNPSAADKLGSYCAALSGLGQKKGDFPS